MAIVRWGSNPDEVSDFDRLRQEVNRLFNVFSPGTEPFVSGVYPALNLTDDGDSFYAWAELPGVNLIATLKVSPH
jgi:HSP20 family molecular chaperone IbpA